jgi:hypothetical protein
MPYLRLENFGQGGYNPDNYETGLSPGQWSNMENADIYNGDLYACGREPVRFPDCPFSIFYSYLFVSGGRPVYVASDGNDVAVYVEGQWTTLLSSLGGGLITFDNFLGTLIINSQTSGPYYWGGISSDLLDASWDEGPDESWNGGTDVDWDGSVSAEDSWDSGPDESWNGGLDISWSTLTLQPAALLPGWPAGATCLQIVAFSNYLVALSVDNPNADGDVAAPYLVMWSDAAPPGSIPTSWTPATDNLAGDFLIQDTYGPISGGKKLRNSLIVYKSDSIYRMFETFDTDLVMAYERVVSLPSIDSPYGVAEYANQHYFVSKAGLFVFDGQQATPIDYGRVHGAVISVSLFSGFSRVQVVTNQTDAEIWFGLRQREDGPITQVLKYSIPYNAFVLHDYGPTLTSLASGQYSEDDFDADSWDGGASTSWEEGDDEPWENDLRGDLIDRVFLADGTNVKTYEPLRGGVTGQSARATSLLRYGIQLSDPTRKVILRAIYPEMEGGDEVTFQVGTQQQPWRSLDGQEPQIVWGPDRSFRPGTDLKLPLRDIGSTFALRVKSSATSQSDNAFWRLHAIGFEFSVLGERG